MKRKHKEDPEGALAVPNAALAIFLANIGPTSSVRMFEGSCILLALVFSLTQESFLLLLHAQNCNLPIASRLAPFFFGPPFACAGQDCGGQLPNLL